MILRKHISKIIFLFLGWVFTPHLAHAHVKWFSEFSFADKPLQVTEVLSPVFWLFMMLSLTAVGLLTYLNKKLDKQAGFQRVVDWVDQHKHQSSTVMRAAAAAVFLMSFQSGSLFVPELKAGHAFIGWLNFIAAIFLLFPKTVKLAGLMMIGLYVYGLCIFGFLHMLDYLLFLGAGYYLCVVYYPSFKVKETGLIALYSTVGFSLCWVAMEKLLYPQWGLYLLEQNPQLALGFNFTFFLTAAAFIEFALGYLMIICLLQRPLAIVVTLVFFSTTLVFGKLEVIGHTLIHAALIVFILEGAGKTYTPPIHFHTHLRWKLPFAVINFAVAFFVLLFSYQSVAMFRYEQFRDMMTYASVDVTHHPNPPEIDLAIQADIDGSGWNVHVKTHHFKFTPHQAGQAHVDGEGHAHLYINGKKISRVYGEWYYISSLEMGVNTIKVTLNTNDHRLYVVDGKPIEKEIMVNVSQPAKMMPHDS